MKSCPAHSGAETGLRCVPGQQGRRREVGAPDQQHDAAFTHRLRQPHLCWTFSRRFFHPLGGPWHPGFLTLGQWQAARAPLCPPPTSGCDLLPWTTPASPHPAL